MGRTSVLAEVHSEELHSMAFVQCWQAVNLLMMVWCLSMIEDLCFLSIALELASKGHASKVDLLVGDIYGGDYEEYDLSASWLWIVHCSFQLLVETVAASLGKLVRPKDRDSATPQDMARGLLDAVTNNIVSWTRFVWTELMVVLGLNRTSPCSAALNQQCCFCRQLLPTQ